ncbi:MAG: arginine--tRNA ligase [Verrucomicrobia bacterium]|jgi:arginyl-tRNA synthetase|nr:MAG: arginine--tRNA ligase [Verrucomicrobiota bacterium]MDH4470696.1 arginine--tRNA ligase [Verrucomicrobiae bacterium]
MSFYKTSQEILTERLRAALESMDLSPDFALITMTADPRFGDYQTNAAMVAAKHHKKNPREIAAQLVAHLNVADCSERPEIAGAGFINFRLQKTFLEKKIDELHRDPRLGIPKTPQPQTIIIDFSSPNIAKTMHVGHIRSTILGESLARIARFLGHQVITDNHLGDWGTQFGKVIYGFKHLLNKESLEKNSIQELVRLYREVNDLEEKDPRLKVSVREELVKLQKGDEENLDIWKKVVALSWQEFEKLYHVLDVSFDERLGESFYNNALEPLVKRLLAKSIAQKSEGAVAIFFPHHPTLEEKPFLIQKTDGGFLYATTDIATLEYREQRWHPDAVWYVCGAPQQLHFEQLFAVACKLGLTSDFRHIAFGSILGEDRKMMKTRSGENIELGSLLQEAIDRALKIVNERNPDSSDEEKRKIATTIGLGALKYSDLMQHRMTDVIFSWDKMLSFQGNTAPYLQNAYVRIRSIFRKEGLEQEERKFSSPILITEEAERRLVLQLLQFGEIIPSILVDARPNILCLALYELANKFHYFYEHCPILKSEESIKESRLALASVTASMLKQGLHLLGIQVPEKM